MLDWLKTILGETYTEELDKKVSEEIGKSFVARTDFNTVNTEKKALSDSLKDRDKQLETLKASTGDVEALKTQIAALQTENANSAKAHEAEIKSIKLDTAVETALAGAKAKNVKAVKALLELNKAELAEDGTVKGLADQIKKLTESTESSFLFETGTPKPGFKGMNPADGKDGNPAGDKTPKDMSYDELCAYIAANPNAPLE